MAISFARSPTPHQGRALAKPIGRVSLVRKTLKTTATRADPVSEKMQEKAQVLDKIRGALWGCEQNNGQVRKQAPAM